MVEEDGLPYQQGSTAQYVTHVNRQIRLQQPEVLFFALLISEA